MYRKTFLKAKTKTSMEQSLLLTLKCFRKSRLQKCSMYLHWRIRITFYTDSRHSCHDNSSKIIWWSLFILIIQFFCFKEKTIRNLIMFYKVILTFWKFVWKFQWKSEVCYFFMKIFRQIQIFTQLQCSPRKTVWSNEMLNKRRLTRFPVDGGSERAQKWKS